MKDLRSIISHNLTILRTRSKLTQLELSEKINYSDKTISKWETGEAIPSVENLVALAKIYNVSIEDIVEENGVNNYNVSANAKLRYSKLFITLLAVAAVWFVSTVVFALIQMVFNEIWWQSFVWATPISCIILLVFNSIWGNKKLNYLIISVFTWTLLASFYLQFIEYNLYISFIVGVPIQIIIVLWSNIKKKPNKKKTQ